MIKRFKTVSLMLLLMGLPAVAAYAETTPIETIEIVQQNGAASGIVVDASGEPLTGASVLVKGTTKGAMVDNDGKFSIAGVKTGQTLRITFIGYQPVEVKWEGQPLQIVLNEDDNALGEVVVTALGIKREKKALGYAVTELKGEDLNVNLVNPVSALQGKIAGVDIAAGDGGLFGNNRIQIRGASTLGDNNQPIYVIDGVIMDNSCHKSSADWNEDSNDYGNELKNLNPNDFESVSVLKGAAATALYGSRGLNGAIVITTKSGKGAQGLGVNFSQTFGFDKVTSTPRFQNEFGDGYMSGYLAGAENGWDNNFDVRQFALDAEGNFSIRNLQGYYGWGPKYDGRDAIYYDGTIRPFEAYENNYRDAYKTGFNSTTNVAIQGGTDRTKFYTSLGYKYANSTTPNNDFERFNFMAKASHKLHERVTLEASVTFANSTPRNAPMNLGLKFCDTTWGRSYDSKTMKDLYKGNHGGLAQTSYGDEYGYIPGRGNWWSMYENDYRQKETQVRPTLKLDIDITSWLKFNAEGNYNYYYTRAENKQPGSGYANEGGYYSISQTTKEQTNFNSNLLVNKTFGDFEIHGFLRYEYYRSFAQAHSMGTNGGLIIHNQYFINNSVNSPSYGASISGEKSISSVAAQVGFSWKNQIYVDVTGRNDWASSLVYADGHGNYSYFYPSVSGSWLITETFRDQLPSCISFWKLRGSWAQVGNDTNPYIINSAWRLNKYDNNGSSYNSVELDRTTYSSSLKPERKNSWEIGMDYRMFMNRLGLDVTYYKENTTDQIMKIDVPYVSGQASQYVNAGNIQNQGVEVALNTVPFRNKDWEWTVDLTYTLNRSKILELHENVADYIALDGDVAYGNFRVGAVAKVGGAYGLLLTDSAIKVDEESGMKVLNFHPSQLTSYWSRDGKVTECGDINPRFLGSLNTGLRYKNWRLSVALDARFGGKVASYGSHYGTAYGFTEASLKWRDKAHGGAEFTSMYDGVAYEDGVRPTDGIYLTGTVIRQGDGSDYVVGSGKYSSGETYLELEEKGVVEPSHSNAFQYRQNQWINAGYDRGVVSDEWLVDLNYIALREISLSYSMPAKWANTVGARALSLSATAHNLGYLLNSMPNGENPEALRGTHTASFRMRNFDGVTTNFMFTLNATF